MKKTSVVFATITLATLLASRMAVNPAQATSYTWQGSTTTLWNTTSNWSSSVVPTSSDEADFTGTLTKSPSVNVSSSLGQFHALGTLGQSFTATIAGGQVLTLYGTNYGGNGMLVDYNNSSGTTVTISGGTVALGAGQLWINNNNSNGPFASGYSLVVSSTVSLGSNMLTLAGSGNTQIGGLISGSGGVIANSSGVVYLTGNNPYSGNTLISGGTLALGNASALRDSTLDTSGTGTLSFGGLTSATFGGLINGGGLVLTNTAGQPVTLAVGNNGVSTTYSGVVMSSSVSGSLTKIGSGALFLTSTNSSYSGVTQISGGVLNVASLTNYGSNSSIGNALQLADTGGLVISGGTLQYTGSTPQNTNRFISIGATATIDASGSPGGTLSFTQTTIKYGKPTTACTLTLTGSNAGPNLFALEIEQKSNGVLTTLVKSGSGTWIITNPENSDSNWGYGGGTQIQAGTLSFASGALGFKGMAFTGNATFQWYGSNTKDISSVTGGLTIDDGVTATFDTNGNNVTFASTLLTGIAATGGLAKIGSGTLTLAASNNYNGGTTLNAGALVVAGGMTLSATGTGAVTLNGGTLAAGPAGGTIGGQVVAGSGPHVIAPGAGQGFAGYGTLNLNGGLVTNANTTLLFNINPTPVSGSIYAGDLINLGGSVLNSSAGGSLSFLGVSVLTTPGDYQLFQNVGTGSSLTALLPSEAGYSYSWAADTLNPSYEDLVVAVAAAGGGTWAANGGGSWTQGSNWSSNPTAPSSGTVMFGSAITAPATVTLDGAQSAGGLVFDNTNRYTLANGTGGPLNLGAGGSATIAVLSGTDTISADVALAGSLAVSATGGAALTLAGSLSDGGAGYGLTLTGNGELVLSGTSSYGGATEVAGGTMYLTNSTALPTGTGLTVGAGGAFIFDPSAAFAPVSGSAAVSPRGRAAVPEPGTWALLAAAALAGLVGWRRRRAER